MVTKRVTVSKIKNGYILTTNYYQGLDGRYEFIAKTLFECFNIIKKIMEFNDAKPNV